jgi:hypothetical protein
MASISAYDSSSLGVLFSSISSKSSSSTSSLLGGTSDLLGISYSDYATIRNGSYSKLLRAYYSDNTSDEVSEAVKTTTSTSKDDTKTLARIQSGAEDLKESAQALLETGDKSVFKEVTTTDEDGKTTTGYDTDAIYKAVSSFVKDYNTMLTQGGDSNTKSILSNTKSLVTNTAANKSSLAAIGITIGSDNKLSIDEETFKKADMSKVKSLFNDRGSYGYQTATRASLIESYAKSEAAKSNTYSSSGSYTYNYSTGEIYSSYM